VSAAGGRVYLVRHAHAGDRTEWSGDDSQRPLSAKGWRQAEGIDTLLSGQTISRVLSSPSLRCVQTVEPLARTRKLRIETEEALLEGSDPRDALQLLEDAADAAAKSGAVVACSHGDVVPGVLDLLRSAGAAIDGALTWPKASTWVLEAGASGRRFARASYLPPPRP
jgi:phosphohistidine phosphatase SixA